MDMSYQDYLMHFIWLILFLIVIFLIAFTVIKILNNIFDKEAEEIVLDHLNKINYFERIDEALLSLFGTDELQRTLRQSNNVVSNFASYMQLNYLCKYFGLVINDETVDNFCKLKKIMKQAVHVDTSDKRIFKKLKKYVPCMSMYYISPQGRSSNKYDLYLFPEKIDELIEQVNNVYKRQMTTRYQRNALTKQMRESILARDNWTCQKCGNSVYNEPNLLLEIDHIIPISMGGKTEPNNLQTLCWRCNREKSDKIEPL